MKIKSVTWTILGKMICTYQWGAHRPNCQNDDDWWQLIHDDWWWYDDNENEDPSNNKEREFTCVMKTPDIIGDWLDFQSQNLTEEIIDITCHSENICAPEWKYENGSHVTARLLKNSYWQVSIVSLRLAV